MDRSLPFGIILTSLDQISPLVDALLDHPLAATSDFGVSAPLFKGTPALAEAHKAHRAARERLHAYIRLGLLDETSRVQIAEVFARQYRQRFGRGERRDIFLASADMIRVAVGLKPLTALEPGLRSDITDSIRAHPHDREVLERELEVSLVRGFPKKDEATLRCDPCYYQIRLKLFVDNLYNPRRYNDGAVAEVIKSLGCAEPFVVELCGHPALAGYAAKVAEDIGEAVEAPVVWLEKENWVR